VVLAGRSLQRLEPLADTIRADGGAAEVAAVDALDKPAVTAAVDALVARHGRLDISFNLIGLGDVQRPLLELSVAEFLQPIVSAMRAHLITTRAAAQHMIRQGAGVILQFGGGGPQTPPGLGGFKVALDALESLRRQWAVELGPHGIRVVTLKTGGIAESLSPDLPYAEAVSAAIACESLLGRGATLADVGNVAAFLASDQARTLTATAVNMSAGALID
jgi:NAD(P)-dependent dehydrogenase (short-subunit alcohol dehydrogenase family)